MELLVLILYFSFWLAVYRFMSAVMRDEPFIKLGGIGYRISLLARKNLTKKNP